MRIPRIKSFFVLFAIGYWLLAVSAFAATPQFLVSWQAQSYAPSWYQGKIFPSRGSPVKINFELIDNGKIVDVGGLAVRWYVNGKLVKNETNGLGLKSLVFGTPDYGGTETEVRISIPDYNGFSLNNTVRIPVKNPEAVIDAKTLNREAQIGDNMFTALPFFFNVPGLNNLSFDWFANGQPADSDTDTPWLLNLNIDSKTPSGFQINLQAIVKNFLSELEFAVSNLQLTVR